ncbi:DoxX family protein [Sphingobacterium shayense]|uniref:MauE/DoxX family redox-associated membrane protein n=1 Tax=Sphingobacterium shayense TaxID=626343 RepID=UPI0015559B17|nr:MauE/DoxX family redox-associated membrane protein [Sphingobacterium shayense]NQD71940.1 DoxX family protein [Sphingobacterium shayense]
MKVLKFILCLLFGLMLIFAGVTKFIPNMPMPEQTAEQLKIHEAFLTLSWITPLVGIFEIIGGILFIIPRTRALGALVCLPIVVGIFTHTVTFDPSGLAFVLPLVLINLWVIWDNKKRYMILVQHDSVGTES